MSNCNFRGRNISRELSESKISLLSVISKGCLTNVFVFGTSLINAVHLRRAQVLTSFEKLCSKKQSAQHNIFPNTLFTHCVDVMIDVGVLLI